MSEPHDPLDRPVVLIGMMGAGKSSVGRRLARALGTTFSDSDHEVAEAAGRPIPEIFAELGEAAFRDGERKVIARLVAERPARVIATGGGAFMDPETRAFLKAEADTVWIDAALETLWDRVKDKPGRPLLETDDPRGTLAALLERRAPVYAEADHRVVSEPDQPHEAVVARILETLGRAAVSYPPEGNYDD